MEEMRDNLLGSMHVHGLRNSCSQTTQQQRQHLQEGKVSKMHYFTTFNPFSTSNVKLTIVGNCSSYGFIKISRVSYAGCTTIANNIEAKLVKILLQTAAKENEEKKLTKDPQ
jgi:hypothetical protein